MNSRDDTTTCVYEPEWKLKLLLWPHPMLKKVCEPVLETDPEYRDQLKEMERICKSYKGLGLSANQVGLNKRMLVAHTPLGFRTFINPKVTKFTGTWYQAQEGCLSLPGIVAPARRNTAIELEYQPDTWGTPVTETFTDQLAHILQHEVEHLDGKMMIDRLPGGQRDQIRSYMRKVAAGR